MLTEDQRKYIKEKIEKKLEMLQEDILYLKEETKPIAPENAIGRVSRMDAINNKSVAENALRNAEEKLKKYFEALENIDKEDFGKCQKCKKDIEIERIAFMPESLRCSVCARQRI